MKSAHLAALLLAALTSFTPLQAMAAGAPAAPLPAESGEVIVGFKPEAQSVRKHALAARADAAAVQATLALRAGSLGARLGRMLHSGAAVGERAQVMHAPGLDAATLARLLQADPDVAYAVPDGRKRLVAAPNDPLYPATAPGVRPGGPDSGQWYLRAPDATVKSAIDIEGAWARTTGSGNVVVAVLDTGVRFEHPDLGRVASGGRLLPGYDFVSNPAVANDGEGRDGDPSDPGDWVTTADKGTSTFSGCDVSPSSWHGTTTASLIGAATNNGVGMAGTAPGVTVLPVRVLGKCFGNDSDILAGMRWAAGIPVAGVPTNPNPAKVINLSLGGEGACSALYQAAVDEITARGVVIVAAAGNTAGRAVNEPANCRGVIGVLALRHVGTKVGFSDLGPEISIAAPGGNCVNLQGPCLYPMLGATNSGSQGPGTSGWTDGVRATVGTSFSSPLVAGVAALIFSQNPNLSAPRVRDAIRASSRAFPSTGADNGPDDPTPVAQCQAPTNVDQSQCYCTTALCGSGMLDASASLTAVAAGVVSKIGVATAAPAAASLVQLRSDSLPIVDDRIVGTSWSLVDGGGIVTRFESATSESLASVIPSGVGSFRVRLTVTGNLGGQASSEATVQVQAASAVPAPAESGGGGGASSGVWVAGVALAAALLRRLRPAGGLKAARHRA